MYTMTHLQIRFLQIVNFSKDWDHRKYVNVVWFIDNIPKLETYLATTRTHFNALRLLELLKNYFGSIEIRSWDWGILKSTDDAYLS